MPVIGVIEAELQGSRVESSGGIGPLFRRTTVTAPYRTAEFLSRTLRGFERAGAFFVISLFVDEDDLLADVEDEEVSLEEARALVDAALLQDAEGFTVMLAHEDEAAHDMLTVDGSRTHEQGDPTFTVHVSRQLEPWDDDAGAPDLLDEPDPLDEMEAFLQRLLGQLDRELALADPDLRVWDDHAGEPIVEQPYPIAGAG